MLGFLLAGRYIFAGLADGHTFSRLVAAQTVAATFLGHRVPKLAVGACPAFMFLIVPNRFVDIDLGAAYALTILKNLST